MRRNCTFVLLLCWGYAQFQSEAVYKYYSAEDLMEVQKKTPLKYEGLKYEFSESFEVEAPPGTPPEAVAAFIRGFDPRLLERHESEDRVYTVGQYRVVLKSYERCQAELCARYPDACRGASTTEGQNLQKLARP